MATISDVANEANVSMATVSRVLNNSYYVTEEKRRRVLEAIEKVGYQPPLKTARAQSAEEPGEFGEKKLILIICGNLIPELVYPLQRYAAASGLQTAVTHYGSAADYDHLAALLAQLSPLLGGVVLINAPDNSRRFQSLLEELPLVQIGEPIMERVPNTVVYNDEIRMGEDATDTLFKLGCRHIGFLVAQPTASIPLIFKGLRLKGYYLAHLSRSLTPDQSYIEYGDVTIEGGYESMKKLMARHPELDGVIGITDKVAQGAIYAIRRAGKTTEDIRVFSMDSSEVWDFDSKNFPYSYPNHDQMAAAAVQMLRDILREKPAGDYKVVIPYSIFLSK